jgi:hypothetical protein
MRVDHRLTYYFLRILYMARKTRSNKRSKIRKTRRNKNKKYSGGDLYQRDIFNLLNGCNPGYPENPGAGGAVVLDGAYCHLTLFPNELVKRTAHVTFNDGSKQWLRYSVYEGVLPGNAVRNPNHNDPDFIQFVNIFGCIAEKLVRQNQ